MPFLTARACVHQVDGDFAIAVVLFSASLHRLEAKSKQLLYQLRWLQFCLTGGQALAHSLELVYFHGNLHCRPAHGLMLLLHRLSPVEGLHPHIVAMQRVLDLDKGSRHAQQHCPPLCFPLSPLILRELVLAPGCPVNLSQSCYVLSWVKSY